MRRSCGSECVSKFERTVSVFSAQTPSPNLEVHELVPHSKVVRIDRIGVEKVEVDKEHHEERPEEHPQQLLVGRQNHTFFRTLLR